MKTRLVTAALAFAISTAAYAQKAKSDETGSTKGQTGETAEQKGASETTTSTKGAEIAETKTVRTSNDWMESHGQIPRLDVGGSFGYNNPAGMLGLEAEYRLYEFLGVGLHGGIGGWGVRLSPVVHAYPFGASNFGLYGEAALSLNLGGDASFTANSETTNLVQSWVPAASVAVGYRRQWLTYFWTSFKLGYQWKIGGDDDYRVVGTTNATTDDINGTLNLLRPGRGLLGGFVIGGSAGVAFL